MQTPVILLMQSMGLGLGEDDLGTPAEAPKDSWEL